MAKRKPKKVDAAKLKEWLKQLPEPTIEQIEEYKESQGVPKKP
jgi:hypothetical protein